MKIERLIDPLEARNMRCPICNKKFEKLNEEKRKNVARGVHWFEIKKKSIILINETARTDIIVSSVNDTARVRFSDIENVWKEQNIEVLCSNNRHSFSLVLQFELNRRKLTIRNQILVKESFVFKHDGKHYELHIDYVGLRTNIRDPSGVAGVKMKPSILQVTDKKDIIYKIDRLFNFQ